MQHSEALDPHQRFSSSVARVEVRRPVIVEYMRITMP